MPMTGSAKNAATRSGPRRSISAASASASLAGTRAVSGISDSEPYPSRLNEIPARLVPNACSPW